MRRSASLACSFWPFESTSLTGVFVGAGFLIVSVRNCVWHDAYSQLENNNQVVSDQGVRKILYQRVRPFPILLISIQIYVSSPSQIVAAFPDGWITSGQVSREVSVMKKKYEKELENE